MDLSESLAAFGTPGFSDVLAGELLKNKSKLPTEKACTAGGWPKDEDIILISNEGETADTVFADIRVSFKETGNPGCGNSLMDIPQMLDCRVVIDKKTGKAVVVAEEDDEPLDEI